MSALIESFAWCMLQVTLLSMAAVVIYAVGCRLRSANPMALLVVALASVGLLTLLCISPWPRWSWSPDESSSLEAAAVQPAAEPNSMDSFNIESDAEVVSDVLADTGITPSGESPSMVASTPRSHEAEAVDQVAAESTWWPNVVWAAWTVSTVGVIRLLISLFYLGRCRRESKPLADEALLSLLDELREQYGIKRPVELCQSPRLGVAATVGWKRPVVLLPAVWRNWTADEQRAVLAHELAHVRQGDFLAWLVSQLPLVAHFYHPLVHWLARRLRFEQELAADALAAKAFADGRQYAVALAGLALGPAPPRRVIAPLGIFMSRPLLMRRIAMLRQTNESGRGQSPWQRYALLSVVVIAAVAVAGLRAAADDEAQLPAPSDPAKTTRVVSLFRVSREAGSLTGQREPTMSDAAWRAYCSSQIVLLKSDWLLQTALQQPDIAELPQVKPQPHPVTWLQQNIRVGFLGDSEILYLLMYCRPRDADATRQLVDAVVKAYEKQVIQAETQRKLLSIDVLSRSLQELTEELTRKTRLYIDTAQALGSAQAGGSAQLAQRLDLARIERIETELMRLESEQLELETSGKQGNSEFYTRRIEQLTQLREELLEKILRSGEVDADLESLRNELDQLRQVVHDMRIKLEVMQIDKDAPPRIERLYGQAIVSSTGPPPRPPTEDRR